MSEQTKELRPGNKRAWAIVVGLGFLQGAGIIQILANSGNFIPAICADLQCDPAQLTLWITLYSLFMAASQPIVGRVWKKISPRIFVTVAFLVSIAALALMSTYTEVWQFWVSGAVIGISGGFYFMVAAPNLITNWFAKKTGLALGVSSVIGGLLSVILSPIDGALVAALGWRTAYVVVVIISCVMALLFTLFVFEFEPAKLGMRPVGWEESQENEAVAETTSSGVPSRQAIASLAFVALFIAGGASSLFGGYQNQWGYAAAEWGYDSMFTSTMISAGSLSVLFGPVLGGLADKFGPWKTATGVLVVAIATLLGLMVGHASMPVVLILVFLFSFQALITGNLIPLMVRDAFGGRDYTKIFSYIQIGIGLIGGFSNPIISSVYSMTGTFNAALWLGVGLAVVTIVLILVAFASKRSLRKKAWVEGESELTQA